MMTRTRWVSCWISLMMLVLLLSSCGEEQQVREVIRPVRYVQVFSTGGTRTRVFSGVAQAGLESRLSFRVPGTIKGVAVEVGDRVNAGDVIAALDPSDYELQVQQAEAGRANAQAQARNAESNYERVRRLYENENASTDTLSFGFATSDTSIVAPGLRPSTEKNNIGPFVTKPLPALKPSK